MDALTRAKFDIIAAIKAGTEGKVRATGHDIVQPPRPELGDLAYACFDAAKAMKKSPRDAALAIVAEFSPTPLVAKATIDGPYVNFTLDRIGYGTAVLKETVTHPATYANDSSKGESVMVEYATQNTHKEVHVGHLRNLALGLSVSRILQAAGYTVVQVSYPGDTGAHVAKCLWGLRKFHANDPAPENKGEFLGRVYADASTRLDLDPTLKLEIDEVLRKLETHDSEWTALWSETRRWCIDEFARIHGELGILFDKIYYESEVEEEGKKIVEGLLEKGIAERSQGAVIVNLEDEGLGAFLVLKSDGSALYSTKELALAARKFVDFAIDASISVVDTRQALYFKQFFATLRRMGFDKKMVHLAYEFVTLKEGAMSSRKGNIVSYQDFRDEMHARAAEETKSRHADWDGGKIKDVSWKIAECAMKFGMLKQDIDRPIVFDMASALSFDGFTGPYVQYAHARLSSILAKAGGGVLAGIEAEATDDAAEFALLRIISLLPQTVRDAAAQYRPSLLAQYLFDLARAVNDFYRDVPVTGAAEEADRNRRVAIVRAAQIALARGLSLLGISAPEEM